MQCVNKGVGESDELSMREKECVEAIILSSRQVFMIGDNSVLSDKTHKQQQQLQQSQSQLASQQQLQSQEQQNLSKLKRKNDKQAAKENIPDTNYKKKSSISKQLMEKNMQFIHDLESKKQANKQTIKSGLLVGRNISPNRNIKGNVTQQVQPSVTATQRTVARTLSQENCISNNKIMQIPSESRNSNEDADKNDNNWCAFNSFGNPQSIQQIANNETILQGSKQMNQQQETTTRNDKMKYEIHQDYGINIENQHISQKQHYQDKNSQSQLYNQQEHLHQDLVDPAKLTQESFVFSDDFMEKSMLSYGIDESKIPCQNNLNTFSNSQSSNDCLSEVLQQIECLYDAKFELSTYLMQTSEAHSVGGVAEAEPSFVEFVLHKFKTEELDNSYIKLYEFLNELEVIIKSDVGQLYQVHLETFISFINNVYTKEELTFFLFARDMLFKMLEKQQSMNIATQKLQHHLNINECREVIEQVYGQNEHKIVERCIGRIVKHIGKDNEQLEICSELFLRVVLEDYIEGKENKILETEEKKILREQQQQVTHLQQVTQQIMSEKVSQFMKCALQDHHSNNQTVDQKQLNMAHQLLSNKAIKLANSLLTGDESRWHALLCVNHPSAQQHEHFLNLRKTLLLIKPNQLGTCSMSALCKNILKTKEFLQAASNLLLCILIPDTQA